MHSRNLLIYKHHTPPYTEYIGLTTSICRQINHQLLVNHYDTTPQM